MGTGRRRKGSARGVGRLLRPPARCERERARACEREREKQRERAKLPGGDEEERPPLGGTPRPTPVYRISFPLSGYCIENVMLKYACTRVGPMVRNLASSFALQRHVSGPGTRFFSTLVLANRGDATSFLALSSSPASLSSSFHLHPRLFRRRRRNRHVCSVGGGAEPLRA